MLNVCLIVTCSRLYKACNCHNHAGNCTYNQTVSDLGLSMSLNGSMMGGGVCVNCQVS